MVEFEVWPPRTRSRVALGPTDLSSAQASHGALGGATPSDPMVIAPRRLAIAPGPGGAVFAVIKMNLG